MNTTIEEFVQAQLSSFDDIMSNVESRSLTNVELAGIVAALKQWRGDGYPIAIGSAAWAFLSISQEEAEELNKTAIAAGWLHFNFGWDKGNLQEYRLLKVIDGKKFLGGEKIAYRLYRCLENGRFVFESSHKSERMAMWALNKVLIEKFGKANL